MVPTLCHRSVLRTRKRDDVRASRRGAAHFEEVHDEPWSASTTTSATRAAASSSTPICHDRADLVTLAAHEAYPGHHTDMPQGAAARPGAELPGGVDPVRATPQALLSEGMAELGPRDGPRRRPDHELRGAAADGLVGDLAPAVRDRPRPPPVRGWGGCRPDDPRARALSRGGARPPERWALAWPERSASAVRFTTDRTSRAYAITFWAARICAALRRRDLSRFRTLLTEQVRISDLLGAVAAAAGRGGADQRRGAPYVAVVGTTAAAEDRQVRAPLAITRSSSAGGLDAIIEDIRLVKLGMAPGGHVCTDTRRGAMAPGREEREGNGRMGATDNEVRRRGLGPASTCSIASARGCPLGSRA